MEGPPSPSSSEGMVPASPSKPGWFTPFRLLCIFNVINLMVYLDRGQNQAQLAAGVAWVYSTAHD